MRPFRGQMGCDAPKCSKPAQVSMVIVISTFGKRMERLQKSTRAVRLCLGCAQKITAGQVPSLMQNGIDTALKIVREHVEGEATATK